MSIAQPTVLILLVFALGMVWYVGFPRHKFRRRRDTISLALRTTIVILIALALAGLQVVQEVEKQAIIFLVDASDSVGVETREAQLEFIQEAVADKPIDDEWGIIVFGGNAVIDKPLSAVTEVSPIRSTVLTGNTDIAEAMQTAISLFSANARRRIVILSDGVSTIGNPIAKAQLAQASGVEVSYVTFFRESAPDVRITELEAPARVTEGQEFDISIGIEAEEAGQAQLLLYSGGRLIQDDMLDLQSGTTRFTLTRTSSESGFLDFTAQIIPVGGGDDFTQNNQLATFSEVVGPPRVLVIASDGIETEYLLPALENVGVEVDIRAPDSIPAETSALADYKSVIVVNVPASDFTTRQMERLDSYVRDLGGGLVFIGGPESYGPGGYFETPLEATLPVETRIKDQQRIPQLTIVYLIDRSGSMSVSDDTGIPNIELAKRAIDLSINFLEPTDRAGIGTFDSGGAWVARIQDVDDTRRLQNLVGTLRPGGGTDILAGLNMVQSDMAREESERKHLILLTDGESNRTGLLATTESLFIDNNVTTSVIALGGGTPILRQMSEVGNGNYHRLDDISKMPSIFAQETVLATRSYIIEDPFTPLLASSSPIVDGITGTPTLNGYVATTAKNTAQVILTAPEPFADPLLVSWQYGLGRSIAFTSDATARWATNWVDWASYTRFWTQAISWTITESATNNIETRIIMQGDSAQILVDARSDSGEFLNNLQLIASVVTPDNENERVVLQQTAPGRYEATFSPEDEGSYFVAINGSGQVDGEAVNFNEINGWVMSYSPEYNQTEPDATLLTRIANLTGGQAMNDDPSLVFAETTEPRTANAPVAPFLLLVAMLLLPFDIAVRRLLITRSDIRHLREWMARRRDSDAVQPERVSSLIDARNRVREQHEASSTIATLKRNRDNTPTDTPDIPTPTAPPKPSPTQPRNVRTGEGSTVSSLLKRKKADDGE